MRAVIWLKAIPCRCNALAKKEFRPMRTVHGGSQADCYKQKFSNQTSLKAALATVAHWMNIRRSSSSDGNASPVHMDMRCKRGPFFDVLEPSSVEAGG